MNLGEPRYTANRQAARFIQKAIPRYTGFRLPETTRPAASSVSGANDGEPQTVAGTPLDIQELFKLLWTDTDRNKVIIQDIAAAYAQGREILVLSERLDHLALLADCLGAYTDCLFVLKGGLGKKQLKTIMEHIQNVPSGSNRIILATGKYLGEGFDLPCLDTLFLVFPFSWKGTLIQYAGRLNRSARGKTEIRIYDYVDEKVPVLQRMFKRRMKGYRDLGFTIEADG
jgi:superfamily II DNA or RNA helicase